MRRKIMILSSILVLVILNTGIYKKEQLKRNGSTLLLGLSPVDPRSLIQGDYMRLGYAMENHISNKKLPSWKKRGHIVIRPDENNVAQFIRFHKQEKLDTGEKLLHFHQNYKGVRIVPDSFFFQEGQAKHFENAKYGVFTFNDSGNHLLVGLADKDRKTISIP